MNVLITGAAGYIGSMLENASPTPMASTRFSGSMSRHTRCEVGIVPNCAGIHGDVAGDAWMSEVRDEAIGVVIHCTYQIREPSDALQTPMDSIESS